MQFLKQTNKKIYKENKVCCAYLQDCTIWAKMFLYINMPMTNNYHNYDYYKIRNFTIKFHYKIQNSVFKNKYNTITIIIFYRNL